MGRLFHIHGCTVRNETIALGHGGRLSVFDIRRFHVGRGGIVLLPFPSSTHSAANGSIGVGEAIVEDILEIDNVRSHDFIAKVIAK